MDSRSRKNLLLGISIMEKKYHAPIIIHQSWCAAGTLYAMQLRSRSWILVLIFTLNILACEAGWVSKFQCGSSELRDPRDTPFRIDSLRGKFESPTKFSLSILAIHNTTHFTCSDLDLRLLETSFRFHVLGIPVGHMESFHSKCPLPITETLTP
jgi:hypothetical protein